MTDKKFTRNCPNCNVTLYYVHARHCNAANKKKSLCKNCTTDKLVYKPKEEFVCISCGVKWMEWRSQLSNPETPFCSKKCWYKHNSKNLISQRFGKLLLIERERRNQTTFYKCKCDCGNIIEATHTNLISGATSSCGCLVVETRGSERKPLKEVVSKAVFNFYKRNARNRNYEWNLSQSQLTELINKNCYYCNSVPSNKFTWKYKYETATLPFNGIDRINNAIGYIPANCVTCCKTCNSAKGELSLEEFKRWASNLHRTLLQS